MTPIVRPPITIWLLFGIVTIVLTAGCGSSRLDAASDANATTVSKSATTGPNLAGVTGMAQVFRVPSVSMEPTLPIGTRVVVKEGPPAVGTIVVFHPPEGSDQKECGSKSYVLNRGGAACDMPKPVESKAELIKRIVAGPGDEIYVRGGRVYRKTQSGDRFERQKDPYIRACGASPECDLPIPVKVLAGHWFLMGDNRGESDDSRYWGPVPTTWIVGVASGRVPRNRH